MGAVGYNPGLETEQSLGPGAVSLSAGTAAIRNAKASSEPVSTTTALPAQLPAPVKAEAVMPLPPSLAMMMPQGVVPSKSSTGKANRTRPVTRSGRKLEVCPCTRVV